MLLIITAVFLSCIFNVSPFSWSTCGNANDPVKVMSLDVKINKTNFALVTGRAKVAFNITSPIQAKVEMYKKLFWGWMLIPCLEEIGSCEYEDVCTLSPYLNEPCPQDFINNQIPCKCPILNGKYNVNNFLVSLKFLPHWIESGSYKIKMKYMQNNQELLCLLIKLVLN